MVKRFYSHVVQDSLYRNSIYLMASTAATACFGFVFWIINARLVPPEQIGIATALISSSALITQLSLLGLKETTIRYLPKSTNKNATINTGMNILTFFTVLLCVCFVILLPVIAPKLMLLRSHIMFMMLFIFSVPAFPLNQLQEGVFVAYRSTGYVLAKNTVGGIAKVLSPFFLAGFGALGLFSAFTLGSIASFVFGMFALMKKFSYAFSPRIDKAIIKEAKRFSVGNYIAGLLTNLPSLVLPLIIIQQIGESESAYYYIDLQIASLLYVIPVATTQSLFAEGSHDDKNIQKHLKKTFALISLLMIPAILITVLLGKNILNVFGVLYAQQGISFLRLLAITGVFVSINCIGSTIVKIKKDMYTYIAVNGIAAVATLTLSFVFLPYGLLGIGYAILLGEASASIIYAFVLRNTLRYTFSN